MRIDIIILLLIVAVMLYRWYQKLPQEKDSEPTSTDMVMDPNCETYIPETEAIQAHIGGRDHYFCSEKCAEEYRKWHSTV